MLLLGDPQKSDIAPWSNAKFFNGKVSAVYVFDTGILLLVFGMEYLVST